MRINRKTILMVMLFLAGTVTGCSGQEDQEVYISEVCPHNMSILHDSIGFYNDYIVLTNASDHVVNIENYGLSDDENNLRRYVFPAVNIEPGEEYIIWASDKTLFGDDFTDDDSLYTGFRIKNNEVLILTDTEGEVIDSLHIPVMNDDEVIIRTSANDRGSIGVSDMMRTTPVDISESVEPPALSHESGYYSAPFQLTMDGGENQIYFTIDGSSPYTSGVLYSGAVPVIDNSSLPNYYANLGPVSVIYDQFYPAEPVSKATIIRAVSKKDDGTFSDEIVATYFVGDEIRDFCDGTYTLSIVSDPEGIFSGYNGIYVTGNVWEMNSEEAIERGVDLHEVPANYNMHGKEWRREAKLTLFAPDGTCLYDESDLINIRGDYSRSIIQKGFNIRTMKSGQKVFDGLFEGTGEILSLRTGGEIDAFDTNMRDSLNSRIAKDMKVSPQRSVCCQVYLNGEYWGCYNLQEHLDTSFLQARYGVSKDNINLIKLKGYTEVVSGMDSDLEQFQSVVDFVSSNDMSIEGNYDKFCEMVDIDSLIDYYCAEIFFGNDDAYIYNNSMWRARKTGSGEYEDGKWRSVLQDLDNTDGYAGEESGAATDSFVDRTWIGSDPFFPGLSANGSFRRRLYDRFVELLSDDFSYEKVEPIISEMEEIYTEPMVHSMRRFKDPNYQADQYGQRIQVLRDFFKDRCRYVDMYLNLHFGE